jgi:3-hydroxyacyl-[acyl-carrier-protein] dehydratase
MQERLKKSGDGLRLVQDLGIDSLAMMEMVLLLEEVLEISINIEELRPVRTLGDVTRFIEHKVGAGLLLGRRMF